MTHKVKTPSAKAQAAGSSTAAADRLKDYLRGYGRNQVETLDHMAAFTGWDVAAGQVIMSRRFALLSAFDDELLTFINGGQVDVQEAARAVAHELRTDAAKGASHD